MTVSKVEITLYVSLLCGGREQLQSPGAILGDPPTLQIKATQIVLSGSKALVCGFEIVICSLVVVRLYSLTVLIRDTQDEMRRRKIVLYSSLQPFDSYWGISGNCS